MVEGAAQPGQLALPFGRLLMAMLTTQTAKESVAFLKPGDSVTLPSYLDLPCLVGQGWRQWGPISGCHISGHPAS